MLKTLVTNGSDHSASFGYAYAECFATTDYATIFMFCVMSLCFLVGTPAHSWCLWFYLRGGRGVGASRVFHVHQSVIELVACMENALQLLNELGFRDEAVFYVDNFVFGASWVGRPLIQACVCVEQYVAVLHPITFLQYKAMRYKLGAVGAVYLISTCYGLYGTNDINFPDPVFNTIYFTVVIIMFFCCVSVLRALKRSGPGRSRSTGQDDEDQRKKKALSIISTNLVLKLVTFLPMAILTMCYEKVDQISYYCVLCPFLASISIFSLIIAPLLKMHKEGYVRCSDPGESEE